jgi:type IV secretory pathway protease TraF
MLEVLGIKNIGKLIPSAEDFKPKDPVSENMAIMNMKPVKAFIYQDHEAHISVHQSLLKDPKIAAVMGQNPQAQAMMAAMQAHISEHVGFEYRKKIEEQLGIPLPSMDEEMSKEIEVEFSRMMAAAGQKLLQQNQAQAAQKQAQEQSQDPIVQMQQQELALKKQEVDIKKQKVILDASAKADQMEIERERIEAQKAIAGMQVGAKSAKDKADLDAKMEAEGVRLGSQIAKDQALTNQTKPTRGE